MIAEEEDHHPLIITEWGRVTVQWWSHKIKGLNKNDFIMVAKMGEVFDNIKTIRADRFYLQAVSSFPQRLIIQSLEDLQHKMPVSQPAEECSP